MSWIPGDVRLALLIAVVVAGLGLEVAHRLPTIRRQVNEQWMHAYRGWVYGGGYGFQLGAGVVTVVTTSAVYSVLAAEVLTSHPLEGALIGAVFGGGRGLSLFAGARLATPMSLVKLDGFLGRSDRASALASQGAQAAIAIVCLAALVT